MIADSAECIVCEILWESAAEKGFTANRINTFVGRIHVPCHPALKNVVATTSFQSTGHHVVDTTQCSGGDHHQIIMAIEA